MDKETIEKANAEYAELRSLYVQKEIQREKELSQKGLFVGLDGPNYFKDIQEWFSGEVQRIKDKYGIN